MKLLASTLLLLSLVLVVFSVDQLQIGKFLLDCFCQYHQSTFYRCNIDYLPIVLYSDFSPYMPKCFKHLLIVGVKKRNQCDRKTKKGDQLAMHYTVITLMIGI